MAKKSRWPAITLVISLTVTSSALVYFSISRRQPVPLIDKATVLYENSFDSYQPTVSDDEWGDVYTDVSKRVAHCLVGGARTFWLREVYSAYRMNMLDPMMDQGYTSDIFWLGRADRDGGHHDASEEALTRDQYRARYQPAFDALDVSDVEWADDIEEDEHKDLCDKVGSFEWQVCLDRVQAAEARLGYNYTFVIKNRPDMVLMRPIQDLDTFPTDAVTLLPYYEEFPAQALPETWAEAAVHEHYQEREKSWLEHGGKSDTFWFMPRAIADVMLTVRRRSIGREWPSDICEGQLHHQLKEAGIKFRAWPMIGKIRRSYAVCLSMMRGQAWRNQFNDIC